MGDEATVTLSEHAPRENTITAAPASSECLKAPKEDFEARR